MTSSISSLVNKLPEGINKIKCKFGDDNKTCELCEIKYKGSESCLEYTNAKDHLMT